MHTYIVEEAKDAQSKVDDALDFLAKDEVEAIDGYKKKSKLLASKAQKSCFCSLLRSRKKKKSTKLSC